MRWVLPVVFALILTGSVVHFWRPTGESRARTVGASEDHAGLAERACRGDAPIPEEADARDGALARLREEIGRASPVARPSDEQILAEARAWVEANRPADRPYNDLEARMLALMDTIFDGGERSALWTLRMAEIETEMIRALDTDGDGDVSDGEVEAFAGSGMAMLDPLGHHYLREKFDTDGDGDLNPEELDRLSRVGRMEGAFAGVLERAELAMWDDDRDGLLSEAERAAGELDARSRLRYRADGGVELADHRVSEEEQAEALLAIGAKFGREHLDSLLSREDMMVSQAVTQPLMEAMRVEEMSQRELRSLIMRSAPVAPERHAFDADQDGAFGPEEIQAHTAAVQEYEQAMARWSAQQSSQMLRLQFEHAAVEHDLDGDGRISSAEWDARLGELLAARDERLFLREYDLDRNGRVGPGELDAFVGWYRAGSLRADANFDGRVDAADLQKVLIDYQSQGG